MRRLTRALSGRRPDGERGVIAVLTAILVMFLAIGMLALTVDLGNITYERSQLQNGADAASIHLATACANATATSGNCSVDSNLRSLAVSNANSSDQLMTVRTDSTTCINAKGMAYVTAHGATPGLATCTTDPTTIDPKALSSCQPWPLAIDPATVSYVEVTTQTEMKSGSNVLPFNFAQMLSGGGTGTTQNTCSRAAWGPASSTGLTFPMTMGTCDWLAAKKYAPLPPYSSAPNTGANPPPEVVAPTNYVTAIFGHANNPENTCSNDPNGGFAFVAPGPNCVVTANIGDWLTSDTGVSIPKNGCPNILQNYLGKIVAVPIFDNFIGTGANGQYHVAAIASFYLAGWTNVSGVKPNKTTSVYNEPATLCPTAACKTGKIEYIWGWFVNAPVSGGGSIGGGPDFGAETIAPAG